MKSLILIHLLFLAFSGCERSSNTKSNEPQTEYSKQEIRTCGYEGSRINAACIPLADYTIISNKPFPAKMKILITYFDKKIEKFNECNLKGDFKVLRGTSPEQIVFDERRKLFYEGMEFEIVDMGESCDNDAIFFSGQIKPDVRSIQGDRDLVIFELEN